MRPHALVAYDHDGNIVATLDHLVARCGGNGCGLAQPHHAHVLGLVDFAAREAANHEHKEAWHVAIEGVTVKGAKVWPEWLGAHFGAYRVELAGQPGAKRIERLVHKESGHVRDRAAIEAAIAAVEPDEQGRRDIRHLVGGPHAPLQLDAAGHAAPRGGNLHLLRHGS